MGDDAEKEDCGDTLLAMEEVETVHHDTKMLADHKKHLDKAANHFAPVSLAEEIEVKGVKFFREIGAADSAYTSYIFLVD